MPTVEQLERRLQIEQDALSRADLTGNPLLIAVSRQGVHNAEVALHEARLKNGDY